MDTSEVVRDLLRLAHALDPEEHASGPLHSVRLLLRAILNNEPFGHVQHLARCALWGAECGIEEFIKQVCEPREELAEVLRDTVERWLGTERFAEASLVISAASVDGFNHDELAYDELLGNLTAVHLLSRAGAHMDADSTDLNTALHSVLDRVSMDTLATDARDDLRAARALGFLAKPLPPAPGGPPPMQTRVPTGGRHRPVLSTLVTTAALTATVAACLQPAAAQNAFWDRVLATVAGVPDTIASGVKGAGEALAAGVMSAAAWTEGIMSSSALVAYDNHINAVFNDPLHGNDTRREQYCVDYFKNKQPGNYEALEQAIKASCFLPDKRRHYIDLAKNARGANDTHIPPGGGGKPQDPPPDPLWRQQEIELTGSFTRFDRQLPSLNDTVALATTRRIEIFAAFKDYDASCKNNATLNERESKLNNIQNGVWVYKSQVDTLVAKTNTLASLLQDAAMYMTALRITNQTVADGYEAEYKNRTDTSRHFLNLQQNHTLSLSSADTNLTILRDDYNEDLKRQNTDISEKKVHAKFIALDGQLASFNHTVTLARTYGDEVAAAFQTYDAFLKTNPPFEDRAVSLTAISVRMLRYEGVCKELERNTSDINDSVRETKDALDLLRVKNATVADSFEAKYTHHVNILKTFPMLIDKCKRSISKNEKKFEKLRAAFESERKNVNGSLLLSLPPSTLQQIYSRQILQLEQKMFSLYNSLMEVDRRRNETAASFERFRVLPGSVTFLEILNSLNDTKTRLNEYETSVIATKELLHTTTTLLRDTNRTLVRFNSSLPLVAGTYLQDFKTKETSIENYRLTVLENLQYLKDARQSLAQNQNSRKRYQWTSNDNPIVNGFPEQPNFYVAIAGVGLFVAMLSLAAYRRPGWSRDWAGFLRSFVHAHPAIASSVLTWAWMAINVVPETIGSGAPVTLLETLGASITLNSAMTMVADLSVTETLQQMRETALPLPATPYALWPYPYVCTYGPPGLEELLREARTNPDAPPNPHLRPRYLFCDPLAPLSATESPPGVLVGTRLETAVERPTTSFKERRGEYTFSIKNLQMGTLFFAQAYVRCRPHDLQLAWDDTTLAQRHIHALLHEELKAYTSAKRDDALRRDSLGGCHDRLCSALAKISGKPADARAFPGFRSDFSGPPGDLTSFLRTLDSKDPLHELLRARVFAETYVLETVSKCFSNNRVVRANSLIACQKMCEDAVKTMSMRLATEAMPTYQEISAPIFEAGEGDLTQVHVLVTVGGIRAVPADTPCVVSGVSSRCYRFQFGRIPNSRDFYVRDINRWEPRLNGFVALPTSYLDAWNTDEHNNTTVHILKRDIALWYMLAYHSRNALGRDDYTDRILSAVYGVHYSWMKVGFKDWSDLCNVNSTHSVLYDPAPAPTNNTTWFDAISEKTIAERRGYILDWLDASRHEALQPTYERAWKMPSWSVETARKSSARQRYAAAAKQVDAWVSRAYGTALTVEAGARWGALTQAPLLTRPVHNPQDTLDIYCAQICKFLFLLWIGGHSSLFQKDKVL